jgi:hydroxypyruvate isomerase
MLKTDICIEPLFPGLNSPEKIRKIAETGFKAVEFWFWDYEFDGQNLIPVPKNIDEIAAIISDLDLVVNDIVVNSSDGAIGGSLTNIKDKARYLVRLEETIAIAKRLKCNKMITCTGNIQESVSMEDQHEAIIETLSCAAEIAEKEGMILLLEALNSTIDHPGYFLTSSKKGFDIVKQINSPNLKLLFDVYHMQIMEGNLVNTIKNNIDYIGHFHSANLPGRNELYSGEINYRFILEEIGKTGYNGYFGLEYWPVGDSAESLKKSMEFLK